MILESRNEKKLKTLGFYQRNQQQILIKSTMSQENTQQTIETRKQLKRRYYRFLQNVNTACKSFLPLQKQNLQPFLDSVDHIVKDLYKFMYQFGYVFFFNISIRQPLDQQSETIIMKIIKLLQEWTNFIKGNSKDQYQEVWGILQLMVQYCHKDHNMLDEIRIRMKLKNSIMWSNEQLLKRISNVKQIIEDKKIPFDSKKIVDPIRSTKLFELTQSIMLSINERTQGQSSVSKLEKYTLSASEILKKHSSNFLEERLLNHCKEIAEKIIDNSNKQILPFCCSIFALKDNSYLKQEGEFHQHKNYHWPIQMASIIKHVKKTIVGFLNRQGGIIYIGMKQTPNNVNSVGIHLSNKQVIQFFEWIHEKCKEIYPDLSKDLTVDYESKYKQEVQLLKKRNIYQKNSQYVVNKYVAVQFLSIIDRNTYQDCYDESSEKELLKKLYLIKIKIKPGTKFETFHLVNQEKAGKQGQIECFIRNDASVSKLSLEEFFRVYSNRMMNYLNEVVQSQKQQENTCPKLHLNF